mmetsp:Transcript_63240/g.150837  ORF Transcript_63240/g.150837 Transcript_63240/m.150837 type:complete len:523 (+) Transcript_63240:82-1650(+)
MGQAHASSAPPPGRLPPKSPFFERLRRPSLKRKASQLANETVHAQLGRRISDFVAGVFAANALTGIGVLTVPYAFQQAGWLLGTVTLTVCMLSAYITGTYVIETEAIANALHYGDGVESLAVQFLPNIQQECREQHADPDHALALFTGSAIKRNSDSSFKIRDRFEVGEMAELLLDSRLASKGVYIAIVLFIYGSLAAFVVTVNTSLSHTMAEVWLGQGGNHAAEDIDFFYRWALLVTFFLAFYLCLGDLQKTKVFTLVVLIVRFVAMLAILLAACSKFLRDAEYSAAEIEDSVASLPRWNSEHFGLVFGNTVYVFTLHHALPSMIAPLETQGDSPCVLLSAFFMVVLIMVVLSLTAMLAFGADLAPFYNINFSSLSWLHGLVGLFIVAYPTLAISTVPTSAITLRNTLGKLFKVAPPDPEEPLTRSTVMLTASVLLPPFIIAFITRDIRALVSCVGGYFGLTVSYAVPLLLIITGRKKLSGLTNPRTFTWRLKSSFGHPVVYVMVLIFYFAALGRQILLAV